jgi:hypothetical protein
VSGYRLGVSDEQAGGATVWYDQDSYDAAYYGWRLLRDYGRDGVTATIQQRRDLDGVWVDALGNPPPLVTRPHDWPHDQ